MPPLASELRNKLERTVVEGRDAAEAGAKVALEALAVHHHEPYRHQKPEERQLRNHLRARARQLGDLQNAKGELDLRHLVHECAYEHWHRMLFARFLAENDLLIEPESGVAITLDECEELAKEEGVDHWTLASRFAQRILPQIFRPDDPLLQVSLAREHRLKLERLLDGLPSEVFTASDALGWVYQFWQSKKKDEVNRSEVKIGADEISAVTQLFTEPYMVNFLLHNTLGAWHAGKHLTAGDAENAETEEELRKKLALPGVAWEYLRFVREEPACDAAKAGKGKGSAGANPQSAIRNPQSPWRPAAGTFDGWPKTAAQLKVLDPCCGSGHFLVAGLHHLVPIRMAEEGLSAAEAVDAVLRDNLHGLEIDERCCQIAAFALAFAAWTYPKAGGYRPLPDLNIACTGIGPQCSAEQWLTLAEQSGMPRRGHEREMMERALVQLHALFSQAPTLGSLIDPKDFAAGTIAADYETIQPYLAAILKAEKADDETRERAIAAAGMVKAADLLATDYTLIITNVPYLGRAGQDDLLRTHLDSHFRDGKADLATAFVMRCLELCAMNGTVAMVTPHNWLFLSRYTRLRQTLLKEREWNLVARLGHGAFETISGHVVNVVLPLISAQRPRPSHHVAGLDVSGESEPQRKSASLCGELSSSVVLVPQADQLDSPDSRLTLELRSNEPLLGSLAVAVQGLATHDDPRFAFHFWEFDSIPAGWKGLAGTVESTLDFGGRAFVFPWKGGSGAYRENAMALKAEGRLGGWKSGGEAWGKDGVSVSQIGDLPCNLYCGDMFDHSAAVIVPKNPKHLPAIWAFCTSPEYATQVRRIDTALKVTNGSLVKVPFDLAHWQKVAAKKYPDGLPEPESDDPTQWLFHGRPEESTAPLQVAVARLLGYRWPAELDDKMRLSKGARALVKRCDELAKFADDDGIVCIPSVRGEEPAAERLLALLAAAGVKPAKVREMAGGSDLDDWLRDDFFQEHCELFHHRPFVWHIWDGRKRDGFHALVNYHRLCEGGGKGRRVLESLTYAYLGEWITRQKDGVKRGEGGAEDRLAAALELQKRLEAILAGEPPFDIFVRWKPLHEQPIGWEPDINDGVRMNIRPFLAADLPAGRTGAGVLRWKPNIKWDKDRGKEPNRPKADFPWFWGWNDKTVDFLGGKTFDGNRHNDCHYTNDAKRQARTRT